ncbi:MAG: DUF3488 and transglutaminase-like domain-containing protein [Thermoleophilia bacterium]|nr:DUF3488 and transglutaminase-like domain-containing protein [Thermoleophilia bacterium]
MRADRLSLLFTYLVSGLGAGAALLHAAPSFAFLQLVFIGLGAAWDLRERHPISPWMLTTATVIGLLVAIALPNANGPVGRLMSAAVVLMGGKLLAPKANRDHLQIMVLSLILLVGAAILSVNLAFAVLFAAYLLLTTLALVWLPFGATMRTRRVERGLLLRLGGVGLGLVIGALPLLVFFFAGLPRTDVPFLRGVAPAASQVSGFSNQVTLGDVGRIAQSRQVAFRAEILDRKGPLPSAPYWRGLVLEVTDGISWTARPADLLGDPVRRPGAPAPTNTVAQLVYLEPHGLTDLFGLDRPLQVTLPSPWETRVQDAAAQAPRPLNRRIRYEVISDLDDAWPVALPPAQRALDLELPAGLPPVLAQRAQEIVGAETNAYRKAESILAYFHSGEFHYAVSGLGEGQGHPLSVFLEQTKTGYCELFASSMALMLRRVGVPARMVAGYLGGDFNPTGNYYLVRQLSAHVWVEAYIDGRGWVRFDPTPAQRGPGFARGSRRGSFRPLVDDGRVALEVAGPGLRLRPRRADRAAPTHGGWSRPPDGLAPRPLGAGGSGCDGAPGSGSGGRNRHLAAAGARKRGRGHLCPPAPAAPPPRSGTQPGRRTLRLRRAGGSRSTGQG